METTENEYEHEFDVIDTSYATGSGAYTAYAIGFALSVVLTLIPYWLVTRHILVGGLLINAIAGLGILQLLVQILFFLHLSGRSKSRWNIIIFVFTIVIVSILVTGSMWIMYNLNSNMMPASDAPNGADSGSQLNTYMWNH